MLIRFFLISMLNCISVAPDDSADMEDFIEDLTFPYLSVDQIEQLDEPISSEELRIKLQSL